MMQCTLQQSRQTDLDADLAAVLANVANLDLRTCLPDALEATGAKELDDCVSSSGVGVGGSGFFRSTNAKDVRTVLFGSVVLCPQLLSISNPDEQSISRRCSSAGPNLFFLP
ncbi:hypothetical protein WICPIJ_006015 [Wickerhamomyces pijperi]|uniref:Uncharacterized protein n=1 Tax=Wickerhamomyces pijperi TaxID=599730 RepID=A0A9P8TL97_WICPI|nr:hypothetical protein WICPIJ_006015 [Wickerhamomyces pijperi]